MRQPCIRGGCYEGVLYAGSLAIKSAFFGEGTGPILLDRVQCRGNESTLLECASEQELGQHNCRHHQDASVICHIPSECLVRGSGRFLASNQRVQV